MGSCNLVICLVSRVEKVEKFDKRRDESEGIFEVEIYMNCFLNVGFWEFELIDLREDIESVLVVFFSVEGFGFEVDDEMLLDIVILLFLLEEGSDNGIVEVRNCIKCEFGLFGFCDIFNNLLFLLCFLKWK